MTTDQRIELLVTSTATLVAQLTELKTLEEQLRQARKAMMLQTSASPPEIRGFETVKYQ
jgi:hypothetical protein